MAGGLVEVFKRCFFPLVFIPYHSPISSSEHNSYSCTSSTRDVEELTDRDIGNPSQVWQPPCKLRSVSGRYPQHIKVLSMRSILDTISILHEPVFVFRSSLPSLAFSMERRMAESFWIRSEIIRFQLDLDNTSERTHACSPVENRLNLWQTSILFEQPQTCLLPLLSSSPQLLLSLAMV